MKTVIAFVGLAFLAIASALPIQERGVITDVATKLQDVICDHIRPIATDNHVRPNNHVFPSHVKRDLVDIAHQIEGVIGEISKILTPGAKRGVIEDLAKQLQGVMDGINHVLHPDQAATKRDLVEVGRHHQHNQHNQHNQHIICH